MMMRVDEYGWLGIFCGTGIGIGLCFEYLALQSTTVGPQPQPATFFLCFLGYWAQTIVSGLVVGYLWWHHSPNPNPNNVVSNSSSMTTTTNRNSTTITNYQTTQNPFRGTWTQPVIHALIVSALLDGTAQALNYVGQLNAGYVLFTIFHSSVTLCSVVIAVWILPAIVPTVPPSVSMHQWFGVVLIVLALLVTTLPAPIRSSGSFTLGFLCSGLGSVFLAASYPVSELVFQLSSSNNSSNNNSSNSSNNNSSNSLIGSPGNGNQGDIITPTTTTTTTTTTTVHSTPTIDTSTVVSEELACFLGSLINTALFTLWQLVYTVPHGHASRTEYLRPDRVAPLTRGYALYGLMVGVHSLSFWKSVHQVGTIPTAVSKGAQQAGIFVASHLVYCHRDPNECILPPSSSSSHPNTVLTMWMQAQKLVAVLLCCIGVVVYTLYPSSSSSTQQHQQQQYDQNQYQQLHMHSNDTGNNDDATDGNTRQQHEETIPSREQSETVRLLST